MNIYKRNNTYMITVSCGRDKDGHQIKRYTTYKPPKGLTPKQEPKAATEYAEDYERKIKGGADAKQLRMTFRTYCQEVYFKEHLPTLKPKTASGYRIVAEKRLIPYFGDIQITKISARDVRMWLASLDHQDGRGEKISPNTTGSWFRTLSAILRYAFEQSIINENPCKRVKTPAKPQSDVQALQIEDVQKIITKLPEHPDNRAKMFILLALNTGIRETEDAGPERRDINHNKRTTTIRRTSQYILELT